MPAAPLAYSYRRFSSTEQSKGDSIRRQTALRDEYVRRKGLTLDTQLRLTDRSVSAHRGKQRSDSSDLGQFLNMVRAGRIRPGSYLIVESLDRLSREEVDTALELVLSLTGAGIVVVQLHPAEVEYKKPVDPMKLIIGIMELARGHSESRMKSVRLAESWAGRREAARQGTRIATGRGPSWLKADGKTGWQIIEDRAKVVRLIFGMAAGGQSVSRILRHLTTTRVPPVSHRKAWSHSGIARILNDRSVLGEYRPTCQGEPDGQPLTNYYPAIVPTDLWHRAKGGLTERKKLTPSRAKRVNLFSGLMWQAGDRDDAIHSHQKDATRRYINARGKTGEKRAVTFDAEILDRAIVGSLGELDPADLDETTGGGETATLEGELNDIDRQLSAIEAQLVEGGAVAALAGAARKLEGRRAAVSEQLDEVRGRLASPLSAALTECRHLGLLDSDEGRLRLRSAIRRVVHRIDVMVVRDGRRSIAAAQVEFNGSRQGRRTVLVFHRTRLTGRNGYGQPEWSRWETSKGYFHPDGGYVGTQFNFYYLDRVQDTLSVMVEAAGWVEN